MSSYAKFVRSRFGRSVSLVGIVGALVAGPLVQSPVADASTPIRTTIGTPAFAPAAGVSGSCAIAGCLDAVDAYNTWEQDNFPTSRGWYSWPVGGCNFAGGQYYNYDGRLPTGDTFLEYDIYPRTCGAHRDAYRIVLDRATGQAWYSPDHYATFYEIV